MSTDPTPQDNGKVPASDAATQPVVDPALPATQDSEQPSGIAEPALTPPPGWEEGSASTPSSVSTPSSAQSPPAEPVWTAAAAPTIPLAGAQAAWASQTPTPGAGSGQPVPASPASQKRAAQTMKAGPRTGPIVWGALILAFCGYAAQRAFGDGELDTAAWITATVIGLGVLLLGVGTAVIIRNRRNARGPSV